MKQLCSALLILASFSCLADVARLNYFPVEDFYTTLKYQYINQNIYASNPGRTAQTKRRYGQDLQFAVYSRLLTSSFLGLSFDYGEGEETGSRYGDVALKEYEFQGFSDPELDYYTRLINQGPDAGSWDAQILLKPGLFESKVGSSRANRFNGYTTFESRLIHGFHENQWDFRSVFALRYFSSGVERRKRGEERLRLEPHLDGIFSFQAQYQIYESFYLTPGIGMIYRGSQRLNGKTSSRTIQAGTGSQFELEGKKTFSSQRSLALSYATYRNEYFVRASPENFDGKVRNHALNLKWLNAF